jgi:hypothetical protein
MVAAVLLSVSLTACSRQSPVAPEQTTQVIQVPRVQPNAIIRSAKYVSQRDSRWAGYQLGTCSGETIGSAGCAMTSVYMIHTGKPWSTTATPQDFNVWLRNNAGYSGGCLLAWSRAADWDGPYGVRYMGPSTISSASQMKDFIDHGEMLVARSGRFSTHFVLIVGYSDSGTNLSDFIYYDPYDLSCTPRRVGDGWVNAGRAIHRYYV